MIASYDWSGGTEAMMRFGPATGPVVIAAMPPFEEANRTRAFMVAMLRALADRGVAGALPDLPGMGESLIETEHASLGDWQGACRSAAETLKTGHNSVHGFGLRGGALLDANANLASRYYFAPVPGANIVRELVRTRLAAAKEDGETFDPKAIDPPGPPVDLAGNRIDRRLLADLNAATPSTAGPIRIVRLETDAQAADLKIAAAPLWRRAEPDNDIALAHMIAEDLAAWIATCAG